jgi:KUP system potassium uptake protein
MKEEKPEHVVTEQPEKLDYAGSQPEGGPTGERLWFLTLTALGVVYGDIGTSPLYAFRFAFLAHKSIHPSSENVLGVLSLILWSLIIVVSIKYVLYVMRADNHGEGGILALMALIVPSGEPRRKRWIIVAMGVFGACLLYGDGMITPAISVLSAVDGLKVATNAFAPYLMPITAGILVVLFIFQRHGTSGVGSVFGPIMIIWFVILAILGIKGIISRPEVLEAVNPIHALRFILANGWPGYLVLGTVFLAVTGSEALYADMGHFGSKPIRIAWFSLVLPSLLLNYFGQGATLLGNPIATTQPFYQLAPRWALYPLVTLATIATIIASQAVISGTFSLTRQAALLGQFPRIRIVQTSSSEIGQIYVPTFNWVLMTVTVGLVLIFRSSENLAAAYGVAVTTTMVITTILAYILVRERWKWGLAPALAVTATLLIVDLGFFGANIIKFVEGGWVPLLIAASVYTLMSTWRRGVDLLGERLSSSQEEALHTLLERLENDPPVRVPGTIAFMTGNPRGIPSTLLHQLRYNRSLHETVLLLTVIIEDAPRIRASERLEIKELGHGLLRVVLTFGFMESPDVPAALRLSHRLGFDIDPDQIYYVIGRRIVLPTDRHPGMAPWRARLFAFMSRNAALTTTFYNLPADRVTELGLRIEI